MSGVKIYIAGVGGQGSLTFSRLLGEAALDAGLGVVVSEVHGMSQRGGVVESSVLIGDYESPLIGSGDADIVVAFEPAEALRAVSKMSAKTLVLVNSRKTIPFTVTLGAAAYPDLESAFETLRTLCEGLYVIDAAGLAAKAGSAMAVNMVLMGALAALGRLPIGTEGMRATLGEKQPARFRETNDAAFELGRRAIAHAAS
ncbi:MAG: indolepyruvate oxidoreductase subunit beta [Deltaproteobacteria bacterium]|nr:indolepyruvate oxidoreductase subunit beta [Deltaproteobacteria bacterium]